jgi:hypothetical protein
VKFSQAYYLFIIRGQHKVANNSMRKICALRIKCANC